MIKMNDQKYSPWIMTIMGFIAVIVYRNIIDYIFPQIQNDTSLKLLSIIPLIPILVFVFLLGIKIFKIKFADTVNEQKK